MDTLCEDQYTFLVISCSVLRMRNIADKSCRENWSTHVMFSSVIHSLVFSLEGWAWQEPEPSCDRYGSGTLHPGQVLGGSLPLLSPAFRHSRFSRRVPPSAMTREILAAKGGTVGEKDVQSKFRLPRKFRDLLHAANLRHGTDGHTSLPKEGVLRIFFTPKIRVWTRKLWVLKASTLPLDHRSCFMFNTFRKLCHLWDNVETLQIQQATGDNIVGYMGIACWIPKSTTHTQNMLYLLLFQCLNVTFICMMPVLYENTTAVVVADRIVQQLQEAIWTRKVLCRSHLLLYILWSVNRRPFCLQCY